MSTEATPQTLSTAIETSGLSTVTTTGIAASQRLGTIYNTTAFAAAIPVWFHPLQTGKYLAVIAEYWTNGVVGSGGPQTYSDHDVVAIPTWATIGPAGGSLTDLAEIPSRMAGTRVLNGACSRVDFLYTIGTLSGVGHAAHYRIDSGGQKILQGEEILATVGASDVIFDAGCYIDGDYLVVFGTDDDDLLYRARKHWGRIGMHSDPNQQWQYWGTKGWYADPDELTPLRTSPSVDIPVGSLTAITHANFRDREYIAVSRDSVNTKLFSSRRIDPYWTFAGEVLDADLVYLQPQLPYNPAAMPVGITAGIPYLTVINDATSGAESLKVAWDLWPL